MMSVKSEVTQEKKESSAFDLAVVLLQAVAIAIVIRIFLFQPLNIPSGSMIPTLLVGDYLFVSKYSYGYSRYSFPFGLDLFQGRILFSGPHPGDVIVFKTPARQLDRLHQAACGPSRQPDSDDWRRLAHQWRAREARTRR